MQINRYFGYLPINIKAFSKLWVSLFSGVSSDLVYPLIDSLDHRMVANKNKQLLIDNHQSIRFEASLQNALAKKSSRESATKSIFRADYIKWRGNVRRFNK